MKKNTLQKVLAMTLAGVMTMGMLTGCGNDKETSGNTNGSSSTPESTKEAQSKTEDSSATEGSYADYSGGFEKQVTIQIPVYDRAFEGWNVTDNTYTQWVQKEFGDKYNIKVEYVAIGRSTEVTDYMQMLGAGSAPTLLCIMTCPRQSAIIPKALCRPWIWMKLLTMRLPTIQT